MITPYQCCLETKTDKIATLLSAGIVYTYETSYSNTFTKNDHELP